MKSTGEVMGSDDRFGKAFAKAQMGAGAPLPVGGNAFLSVRDEDKRHAARIGRSLEELGFRLFATRGTAVELERAGVAVSALSRASEGSPNVVEMLERGQVALVINTPGGKKPRSDGVIIRSMAVARGVPCITTVQGAFASISGMRAMASGELQVMPLQEQYAHAAAGNGGGGP
jgi:carbamoyl-phosphate synthase large subunit